MATESIVGITIQARAMRPRVSFRNLRCQCAAEAARMTPDDLEAIRQVIREELRQCGLRPEAPAGPGVWRFNPSADVWEPAASPALATPASESL